MSPQLYIGQKELKSFLLFLVVQINKKLYPFTSSLEERRIEMIKKQMKIRIIRNREKEKLHTVNAEESSVLRERWQSDECMNAIASFLSRKAKL